MKRYIDIYIYIYTYTRSPPRDARQSDCWANVHRPLDGAKEDRCSTRECTQHLLLRYVPEEVGGLAAWLVFCAVLLYRCSLVPVAQPGGVCSLSRLAWAGWVGWLGWLLWLHSTNPKDLSQSPVTLCHVKCDSPSRPSRVGFTEPGSIGARSPLFKKADSFQSIGKPRQEAGPARFGPRRKRKSKQDAGAIPPVPTKCSPEVAACPCSTTRRNWYVSES
jgi:hypothetical protein